MAKKKGRYNEEFKKGATDPSSRAPWVEGDVVMRITHPKLAFIYLFLLASCSGTATSTPQSSLLAEEVPVLVTESKTGHFSVDTETDLAWSNRVSIPLQYSETTSYCNSLGKGWRLPTVGELQTTMSRSGDAMRMKPAWTKGLPENGLLFSGEQIPRVDDLKQPFVVRIENGESFAGLGLEGYARCVSGPVSREQGPFPMPAEPLMAERWWEQSDACPAGSVARGTAGRLVACTNSEGKTMGRFSSWTKTQRIDASYQNETLHGMAVTWSANGLKISEENYQLGARHGPSTLWYENGEKQSDSTYAGGKLHGKALKWRANGLEESAVSYRHGELHGRSTVWHENGEKHSESTFANGKLTGKVLIWRDDGLKESEKTYRNGELHGSSSSYFANGETASESNFANGLMSGVHQRWTEQGGLLERTVYANARIVDQVHYDNGEPRDGNIETKHPNGVVSYVGVFKQGHAQGKHYGYYPNGEPQFERNYNAKGIPSGRSVDWYSTGQVREGSMFVQGAMHGERTFFGEDGKPQERFRYNQGVLIRE